MVTLNYDITKDAYIDFFEHIYWNNPKKRKTRIIKVVKQAILLSVFFAFINISGNYFHLIKFAIPIFILFLGLTFLPLITGKSDIKKQAETIADNPENESIFKKTTLIADDSLLTLKYELGELKYYWKAIIKKTETATYYYLFQNSMQAIIIPKSAFKNNEEKIAFDKILSRNLSLDAEIRDAIKS
jgi:YcxB-like protein